MTRRVLAIGAHGDDVEIGAAGYLQRFEERLIVVATAGEVGGNPGNRRQESMAAARTLGAEFRQLTQPDTRIDVVDLSNELENLAKCYRPHVVLTMSGVDTHQDHRAVKQATMIAFRDLPATILAYVTPSSAEAFQPNWFVRMTDAQMRVKLDAITCHQSQRSRSYLSDAYILGMGRYWAMVTRSSVDYVEPYELVRYWEPT